MSRMTYRTALALVLSLGLGNAEEASKHAAIRDRVQNLHRLQAEHLRKVAAGEIKPGDDLRDQWPHIQKQVGDLRGMIDSLNGLSTDSTERPELESKLFASLQMIGIHLENASHPDVEPQVLDKADLAEMERIEGAISGMKFGDRGAAKPVKMLGPDPSFTLIHLPVPIILECQPGERVFLTATTGGAFHNGLSLIELKADEQGIARAAWSSVGDAVGDCHIMVHSESAIETRQFRIKVVSPSLPSLEGYPQPEHLKGEIPRLKSKMTITKGRAFKLAD